MWANGQGLHRIREHQPLESVRCQEQRGYLENWVYFLFRTGNISHVAQKLLCRRHRHRQTRGYRNQEYMQLNASCTENCSESSKEASVISDSPILWKLWTGEVACLIWNTLIKMYVLANTTVPIRILADLFSCPKKTWEAITNSLVIRIQCFSSFLYWILD